MAIQKFCSNERLTDEVNMEALDSSTGTATRSLVNIYYCHFYAYTWNVVVVLYLLLTCHYNYVMCVINKTSAEGYGTSPCHCTQG